MTVELWPAVDRWIIFRDTDVLAGPEGPAIFHPGDLARALDTGGQRQRMTWQGEEVGVLRLAPDQPEPEGLAFLGLRHLLLQAPGDLFPAAATAIQILEWERNHRFCSRCGSPTVAHAAGEYARVCPSCHYHQYPRIQPCVIVAITRDDHILLARSQRAAKLPMYSLLAGFVEVGETLEQAVHREVAEEAGVRVRDLRYAGSQSWPFPSNLMLGFRAEWDSGDIVIQEEELMDAQFFHYRQLPMIPPSGSIAYHLIMACVADLTARFG